MVENDGYFIRLPAKGEVNLSFSEKNTRILKNVFPSTALNVIFDKLYP